MQEWENKPHWLLLPTCCVYWLHCTASNVKPFSMEGHVKSVCLKFMLFSQACTFLLLAQRFWDRTVKPGVLGRAWGPGNPTHSGSAHLSTEVCPFEHCCMYFRIKYALHLSLSLGSEPQPNRDGWLDAFCKEETPGPVWPLLCCASTCPERGRDEILSPSSSFRILFELDEGQILVLRTVLEGYHVL